MDRDEQRGEHLWQGASHDVHGVGKRHTPRQQLAMQVARLDDDKYFAMELRSLHRCHDLLDRRRQARDRRRCDDGVAYADSSRAGWAYREDGVPEADEVERMGE